jgi:hypothetical protein
MLLSSSSTFPEPGRLLVRQGRWRRGVLSAALLGWLAWRGSAAIIVVAKELNSTSAQWVLASLRASEDERLAFTLVRQDRSQGLPPGYHLQLFRALEAHVDPTGVILVAQRPGRVRGRTLAALDSLAAPRVFHALGDEPERMLADLPEAWVLDRRGEFRSLIEPARSLVAEGSDWTLWR